MLSVEVGSVPSGDVPDDQDAEDQLALDQEADDQLALDQDADDQLALDQDAASQLLLPCAELDHDAASNAGVPPPVLSMYTNG